MLEVILALVDNKTIFLDPYVHALMPCILTLLLAKRIGPVIKLTQENKEEWQDALKSQLAIREFAAILLQHIIKVYGSSYSTLRPRITRTLLRALLDSTKPVGTQYGALLGLKNMGNEVLKLVLLGNLKVWYLAIIEKNENDYERQILINALLDTLRKLKLEDKLLNQTKAQDSDDMDIDSNNEISDEVKTKLVERFGKSLADLLIEQEDGKQIIKGIFFGELSV